MNVFGVDFVVNQDGKPYIVDINDFPSFRNIPEAISLISDHIYNTCDTLQVFFKKSIFPRSHF